MSLSSTELGAPAPSGGWPEWVFNTPYRGQIHPQAWPDATISEGANCQRFAYAVLELFGRKVPPHRSSELWHDPGLEHVEPSLVQRLDLVLFNATSDAWGAHVAVALDEGLLHLCAEVGHPAVWQWSDFAGRSRYGVIVGALRAEYTAPTGWCDS